MPYNMETYQQILTILSPTKIDEFIQYSVFTGLPAVEIAHRLPSRSRAYINQCLDELVEKQYLRYEMLIRGPYRYRITEGGSRYLALFQD
jgi:hypothetical protein